MESTIVGLLVGAIVSAVTALTYVVKKLASFGEKALNKFDQVSEKLDKVSGSVDKFTDSNVQLAGEIKVTNALVTDHIRDTKKHLKPCDRQTLDSLG